MHSLLDMHHKTWERLVVILGSYMIDPFLLTANRNCPMQRFLRKKTSFEYFCWEMSIINMGISQERKRLLNIVSRKLISYDVCTSFVLHKLKKTFGGSKWKLVELTCVSRYLAYVSKIVQFSHNGPMSKVESTFGKSCGVFVCMKLLHGLGR
jgi:hypothetical protein